MLAKERQDAIVEQVNSMGSVLVKELSEKYKVTEDSIRKDLTLLEKKGLLKKTYGGAVRVRVNVHEFYVSERKDKNLEEKRIIAQKAYSLIEDGDMIFLDISTSNLELAKLLIQNDSEVTIITNMIEIMLQYVPSQRTKMIFIGGCMSEDRDGFVGSLVNREIERYRFDKAFLGVVGVDIEDNRVETYYVEDGMTKSTVLKSSSEAYMMLESRKLEAQGNYMYASISDFKGIIIERELENNYLKALGKYKVDLL